MKRSNPGNLLVKVLEFALKLDRFIPINHLRILSRAAFLYFSRYIRKISHSTEHINSLKVTEDKYYLVRSMLNGALKAKWTKKSLSIFVKVVFLNDRMKQIKAEWRKKYGAGPPGFIVISPTKLCNLRCPNCYANAATQADQLDYEVFNRIIKEAKTLWGNRFFVLSGGEPLMYRFNGKTVLDIARENDDCMFMMYTNGFMIDDRLAKELGKVGNLTPAISVEGLKETTDKRRGKGAFDKIVAVMNRLRRNKVLFGISITATRQNAAEILSDEFIDFFFKKNNASYGWIFHYMPIGRDVNLDLMPTPEQRVAMWQRSWEIIRKKKIMIADFWNQGTLSNGCIAGGREGGYFHINWHGDVAPCVFFPYAVSNINDIYQSGGNLNDAIQTPFFRAIREWQMNYGYLSNSDGSQTNWLRPCPIRDHFLTARSIIKQYGARPIDYAPHNLLEDENYCQFFCQYDEELKNLTQPIWQHQYLNNR
ncbi:MAG: radical SAM protein [candidate division WOR-3 bacterium]